MRRAFVPHLRSGSFDHASHALSSFQGIAVLKGKIGDAGGAE
jgi:hypothetical protein